MLYEIQLGNLQGMHPVVLTHALLLFSVSTQLSKFHSHLLCIMSVLVLIVWRIYAI
jgi:hypothetical protein